MLLYGRMHGLLCVIVIILPMIYGKPYQDVEHDERAESRFTVHENPPELVVSASPEGVKVQAKPSKLQVIEYPHAVVGQKRDGVRCFEHDCEGSRFDGAGFDTGHIGRLDGVGFVGGFRGHEVSCGFGHLDSCGHDEHTTYVPSHTPPVHVGPNAPPIHVGPHVPAVHVGPHVPSIHYGTHAPIYHVGPHVPFVHMPPPVTTVHAGPMGPPIHVSSPPTVYHQPPVVYHMPHVVGHAANDDENAGSDGGYGEGPHHYVSGGHGEGVSGYGERYSEYSGAHGVGGGFGIGGGMSSGHGAWGRSTIDRISKKEKRHIQNENTDRKKRQSVNYGWHPFPASVHVGPHTPPIHIGPHYPPVHIGPHVPAVHIGPHVPYINIPAHVPAIHVRPHVPAVHISPPVPIINAGNHVPAVHVTSPPTVYHRPPIVIHQPHIVHGHHHGMGDSHGHEIYGNYGNSMMGNGHMMGGDDSHMTHEGYSYMGGHDAGNFVNNVGHDGGMVGGREGGFMSGGPHDSGNFMGGHDNGMMGGHEGFIGGHEGNSGGYMGKRSNIPKKVNNFEKGSFSVKNLYSMIRPRRQILGGGGDGGDSVIFVHPGGSQSPVGPNVRGESPLAGLETGVGLRSGLGSSPVENPSRSLASRQGNAFVKSGLSGLSSITNSLGGQDGNFGGLTAGHGIPSGLAGLGGLQNPLSGLSGNDGGALGTGALGAGDDANGGIPDSIGPALGGSSLRSSSLAGSMSNSAMAGGTMSDSVMSGSSLTSSETPQSAHDDGYTGDTSGMSLGGLQPAGGGFSEDNGHGEDSSSLNYQRSLFPSPNFSKVTSSVKEFDFEKDLDSSTERETKSTILRDEEKDTRERVHKDIIPRHMNYGHN